jgi:hypothetical protein
MIYLLVILLITYIFLVIALVILYRLAKKFNQ